MTAELNIRVTDRPTTGGGASREMRRQGLIPGVVYGEEKPNLSVGIDPRDISKGVHHPNFFTNVFEIKVNGAKEQVLVKDIQFHPVTDAPIHVDFLRVGKKSRVKLNVPIVFTNRLKSPGLKQGGTLTPTMRDIGVVCMSANIPASLEVDLTGKEVNARMTTHDFNLPEGVRLANLRQEGATVANIVPPKVRKAGPAE